MCPRLEMIAGGGTRRIMKTNHHYLYLMPIKTKIPNDYGHFFITFTCHGWLPLIEITNSYDMVYNWFDILKQNRHFITGYVIMPNHVHATIAFRKTKKEINKIIGDGKRFMGYEIINRQKEKQENKLLDKLSAAVNKSDKAKGKLYEIWEDSFDWKECIGDEFT
jgi:hypothetical protein